MKPRSFEEAVKQYDRLIKGQMKKLSLYRDWDEFYQCGLIALWRAYEQFEEGKGSFAAYALYTVRGYLLVQLQKETRYGKRHTSWDPILAETLYDESPAEDIMHCLTSLQVKERYLVGERIGNRRKLTDIARELHITYDQARYMYARAITKLREEYAGS